MNGKKTRTGTRNAYQVRLEELRQKHLLECGERLKEERRRLGYSVIEFANMLGIHRNTQGNYEAGREPPEDYLAAAKEVGVDVAFVIGGERLSHVAAHCAHTAHDVFARALSLGLCELAPDVVAMLFFLVANDDEWCSSGFEGGMDDAQIDSLFEAAFRKPDEFNEAAIAISKYGIKASGESPTPKNEAAMILETLSVYEKNRENLHLSLRDNIRMVAEDVVNLWRDRVGDLADG